MNLFFCRHIVATREGGNLRASQVCAHFEAMTYGGDKPSMWLLIHNLR
jgi:hypothetical protein